MYLLISKIIFAASIFLLTVITGFIPLKIAKHNTRLFGLCDSFSSGIFLSAALLHLLPEAVAKFNTIYSHEYPLAYLVCLVTYIILLIMERGASIYNSLHPANNKVVMPIFLASLFIVHSVVEGAAIGANTTFLEAATIFFAVFAHKSSESFTLTVNLHRFGVSTKSIRKTIAFFSLMTPLGIFIASYMIEASASRSGELLSGMLNAVTAGTFLYLGTEHLTEHLTKDKKSFEKIAEGISLIFGITLMALVAIWV